MRIKDYERAKIAAAAGLAINNDGVVYCPTCGQSIRFNSGNPAVFHEQDCLQHGRVQHFALPFGPRAGLALRDAYSLTNKYQLFAK